MKNGLGRYGMTRKDVDYSKTCMHNPHMIFKTTEEGLTAIDRGESEEKRQKELLAARREEREEARRRSVERGEQAVQKIERLREYQDYER